MKSATETIDGLFEEIRSQYEGDIGAFIPTLAEDGGRMDYAQRIASKALESVAVMGGMDGDDASAARQCVYDSVVAGISLAYAYLDRTDVARQSPAGGEMPHFRGELHVPSGATPDYVIALYSIIGAAASDYELSIGGLADSLRGVLMADHKKIIASAVSFGMAQLYSRRTE